MTYTSRLPEIQVELVAQINTVANAVADKVAQRARERVPIDTGQLQEAIHVEHVGLGQYSVVAGDDDAFYGNLVEHGSADTGPRPFLIPSLEATRAEVPRLGANALQGL